MIKHFPDLGYTVIAEPGEYQVDFKVFTITSDDEKGNYGYEDENLHPVWSIDEAEVFVHGFVKWDGCSNWHFDEQDRLMIHRCDKGDLVNIGAILGECWQLASELCEKWDWSTVTGETEGGSHGTA